MRNDYHHLNEISYIILTVTYLLTNFYLFRINQVNFLHLIYLLVILIFCSVLFFYFKGEFPLRKSIFAMFIMIFFGILSGLLSRLYKNYFYSPPPGDATSGTFSYGLVGTFVYIVLVVTFLAIAIAVVNKLKGKYKF